METRSVSEWMCLVPHVRFGLPNQQAPSEVELMAIHYRAIELGLEVHLITDSGKTEVHGQPTRT